MLFGFKISIFKWTMASLWISNRFSLNFKERNNSFPPIGAFLGNKSNISY